MAENERKFYWQGGRLTDGEVSLSVGQVYEIMIAGQRILKDQISCERLMRNVSAELETVENLCAAKS